MTDALAAAAAKLASVLQAENAVLRLLDFPAAGRLLAAKEAATVALAEAQAAAEVLPAALQDMARRLQALAEENQRLLEHAIAVQRRVLGTVARAAAVAHPEPPYGRGGARGARAVPAMALRSNA